MRGVRSLRVNGGDDGLGWKSTTWKRWIESEGGIIFCRVVLIPIGAVSSAEPTSSPSPSMID